MDVGLQVASEVSTTHPDDGRQVNPLVELEAQMASLLSLHNATSDMTLPTLDNSSTHHPHKDLFTAPDSTYVSVIKFNGQPIPPPVLSLGCRVEMQAYKDAAIKKEQEIIARRRRKLLDTVQDIVDRFEISKEESRESSPRSECNATDFTRSNNTRDFTLSNNATEFTLSNNASNFTHNATLPGLSDTEKWHYNEVIKAIEDKKQEEMDICDKEAADILREVDTMLETKTDNDEDKDIDETNPPDSAHQIESTKQSLTIPETRLIPPSISSSVSSGEASPLNTTVVATGDGADNDTEINGTGTEGDFKPPFQSTAIRFSKQQESEENSLSGHAFTIERGNLKMTDKLRESWADSESNMSLLGEYHGLPTPISFLNPDQTAEPSSKTPEESTYNKDKMLPADDKEFSTLSSAQTLSRTHSTHGTVDTVGQSCTLPLSLFSSSSNSTLCEVQDPFASYTDATTPFDATGEEGGGLVRGAPVGQESSNTESGSEVQAVTSNNKETRNNSKSSNQNEETQCKSEGEGTSADEFKSPPKRVRRNSYTLDHPSPALLDAQARNEAPYASDEWSPQVLVDAHPTVRRSLELGGPEQPMKGKIKAEEIGRDDQTKGGVSNVPSGDQQKEPVLTEDNLLRLQMEQFEQMRKQLEQKQREQLEEMLLKQQQEQLALQTEVASLELRFNQQDASKIYSSVFGIEELSQGGERTLEEPQTDIPVLVKAKHGSDTTNPSLRDSLENAFPPPVVISNSHTSPAIHSYSPQLSTMNANHSIISETADNRSMPFYLERSHDRSIDLDYMDVEKSALSAWTPASNVRTQKIYSPSMQAKFERVSAAVKGYLTRRLMKTHKVQSIIQTIRDTVYFVDDFQAETPIKQGRLTPQDVVLAETLLSQLSTARNELYDTFQMLPARDRMAIIAQSRILQQQELRKTYDKSPDDYPSSRNTPVETKPLSAATLKALERKNKSKKLEDVVLNPTKQPARTANQRPLKRPKSANRILRPIQGNQSPPHPIGAPFSFATSSAKDPPKPKAVIHRNTGPNKAIIKSKNKTSANTTSTTTTAAGRKAKNVRRSLYPASTGTTRGPAKGNTRSKVTRNTVLNKK